MDQNSTITGHTQLTGLLGSPVAHSLSPMMHNTAFRLLGIDCVYLCFDVGERDLETAVRGLTACGIRGFNLTMPDKNRMAALCDELSVVAEMIGAVNTVVNEGGRLIGHNTDGKGYMLALKDAGYDVSGKNMTILGGGGAASSIAAQAAVDGVRKIYLAVRSGSRFHNRTVNLAESICSRTSCTAELIDLADTSSLRNAVDDSALLVNATPVGMAPDTDHAVIEDASFFHTNLIVSDIIYNPRETLLLRLARKAGCPVFNGLYMLLYQGAEAFRLWTGVEMPVDEIKRLYFAG